MPARIQPLPPHATLTQPPHPQHTLLQLREEQKQRKAKLGIQAACTFETGDAPPQAKRGGATTTAEEDEEAEAEKQRSIGEMMESSFTGMRYVKKDETSVHNRIMEQYINEKLGTTTTKKPVVVDETAPGATRLTKRDKLLAITEEIHAKARGPSAAKKTANDDEGGVGEGAPIAYSTGIAEVALPMEFKLKNIEATERARLQHEQEQQQRGNKPQEEVIGNLTHNYHHHRKEYAIEMRAKEGKPPATFRRADGEGPKGKDTMTDDHVYAKFKKRKF